MIYDITQPLFECEVYPGDSKPEKREIYRISKGDSYNLTDISLCVHNGTHVDAPYHFYQDGKGIAQIALEKFIGPAYVITHNGDVTEIDAKNMIKMASEANPNAKNKILIRGNATITLEAAKVFAQAGLDLIGNESQTVGSEAEEVEVHLELLKAEVVILEGIRLKGVPDGVYLLNCAPLNLTNTDGAPCRAVLMDLQNPFSVIN